MTDAPACTVRQGGEADTDFRPWLGNRHGNPHQLLHEANNLDVYVRMRREDAARARAEADEFDAAANQMEQAAKDYREWAATAIEAAPGKDAEGIDG